MHLRDVTVVVLAGGKGTRLRPFTAVLPKALVPLGDMSVLEILLRRLKAAGIRNVVVSIGHLGELIMAVCGDGSKFGMELRYVREDEPLGTAGSLGIVGPVTDPVIVMNGDLLTTLNFERMLAYHNDENADITIGTYRREVKIDFGVVELDSHGKFTGFREKPVYPVDVSMGVNVLSHQALEGIVPGKYLDMPDLIISTSSHGGRVTCFREDCFWLDIGRIDDYAAAQEQFDTNREMFLGED